MGDNRTNAGRFAPEHTDDELLAAVRAHEPAATSEVAEEVGMTRQGADRRLRRLRDAGRVNSKKIGASLVWFDTDADPVEDTDDESGRTRRESAPTTSADPSTGADTDGATTADTAAESDPLADVDLPGGRDPEECRDALDAARTYLREQGRATKTELVAEVMPTHPLGYDTDAALDKIGSDGERYRGGWWRQIVRPGLKNLDGVDAPPQGANEWRYTGDDPEEDRSK